MFRSTRTLLLASLIGVAVPLAMAPSAFAAGMGAGSGNAAMKAAPAMHVRGTIVSLDGSTLKVADLGGKTVAVALKSGWTVSGIKSASASDIRQGDFVGIASVPGKSGSEAIEVLVFPKSMKGTGEGSYPWDAKPNSSMTNATVAKMVKKVNARTLTLTYNGGQEKTITVPRDTPIVTVAPATKADLTKGAHVFVPVKQANGTLTAAHIVVGNNGVVPPM